MNKTLIAKKLHELAATIERSEQRPTTMPLRIQFREMYCNDADACSDELIREAARFVNDQLFDLDIKVFTVVRAICKAFDVSGDRTINSNDAACRREPSCS